MPIQENIYDTAALKQQISDLAKRRDESVARISQMQAKYDLAKQELARVEQECRDKGIDPSKLEEALTNVRASLTKAIAETEQAMDAVEAQLSKYTGV